MLSREAKQLFDEIRRTNVEDNDSLDLEEERFQSNQAGALTGEPLGVSFESARLAGVRVVVARPEVRMPGRIVIFLHGGGFVLMSPETHRNFAGHIAKSCRAEVLMPAYSLAPEYPFPKAIDETVHFINSVTESDEFSGKSIALAGDSAGGGLALSATMKMRDEDARLPHYLILLCPWLDLALESQSVIDNKKNAIILKRHKLEQFAALYTGGGIHLEHPYVSPIYGELAGLPPIYIQGAEFDLLLDDATRLQTKARQEGTQLQFELFPLMTHSFQFFAGTIPEADLAISQIGRYLDAVMEMT